MTQAAFGLTPHSAEVDLWLECEHGRFPLGHVGPDFIVMSRPASLPPCEAKVMISVDGHVFGRRVWLARGSSQADAEVAVMELDAAPF